MELILSYADIDPSNSEYIERLEQHKDKIKAILDFKKNVLKILLNKFADTFFKDVIDNNTISYNRISDRVEEYFSRQKNKKLNINQIINILNYQYIITKNFTKYLGILTIEDTIDIAKANVEISNISHTNDKKERYMKKILTEYVENIKIKNPEPVTENNTIDDKFLKNLEIIIQNIIKKSLYKHRYLISYGSYTNYIIDNVYYDDIDIYFPDTYYFLILLMFVFKMILDCELTILGIPYIKGHLSLSYKDKKLLDCIYLNSNIIENIKIANINGIRFIHPILQFINQIRMNNELFRCYKLYDNPNKYISVLKSFLKYIGDDDKSYVNLKKIDELRKTINIKDISYNIYNNVCILDIDKIIKISDLKYDNKFDKVIIISSSPEIIIEELNKINGMYSIKYNAFINEIFFETEQTVGGFKMNNHIPRENLGKFEFSSFIQPNKKYLIMSNLTYTSYYNEEDNVLSIKSLQSMIATVVLYSILKKKEEFSKRLFMFLIASLKLKPESNFKDYYKLILRHKSKNKRHIHLNLNKNEFASFHTDKNKEINKFGYMTKEEFIDMYGLDGGF